MIFLRIKRTDKNTKTNLFFVIAADISTPQPNVILLNVVAFGGVERSVGGEGEGIERGGGGLTIRRRKRWRRSWKRFRKEGEEGGEDGEKRNFGIKVAQKI